MYCKIKSVIPECYLSFGVTHGGTILLTNVENWKDVDTMVDLVNHECKNVCFLSIVVYLGLCLSEEDDIPTLLLFFFCHPSYWN